jgi:hypothetical protein
MEVYLFAFNLILSKIKNVELHFFGTGNIKNSSFSKYIDYLGISKYVFSHGHTNDINYSLNNNNIDIIWYQSYDGLPSGFSALDVICFGYPQVFWDFAFNYQKQSISITDFPCFKELDLFVEFSIRLLVDLEFREKEVLKQQSLINSNHKIDTNIQKIQRFIF